MPTTWPTRATREAVAVGTPVVIDMMPYGFPATVTAVPLGGGSILVEYSTTPRAAGDPGSASWADWPGGTVAVRTTDSLVGPVSAIRATATVADGAVEVIG
jgi:hypothetical protein